LRKKCRLLPAFWESTLIVSTLQEILSKTLLASSTCPKFQKRVILQKGCWCNVRIMAFRPSSTQGDRTMQLKQIMKSAAIGAGLCILLVGVALAQTAPPAAPAPQIAPPAAATAPGTPTRAEDRRAQNRAITEQCRAEVGAQRGPDRREAMRKCVEEKREKAGLNSRTERRDQARGEGRREERQSQMRACRDELKDQRFTEAERRAAMQQCIAKKDPALAAQMACRAEADSKKLEQGSREFRQFMRECRRRG
jgi:hypothetical protein